MKKILIATALSIIASQSSFADAGDFGVNVSAEYTMKNFDLSEVGKKFTDSAKEEYTLVDISNGNPTNVANQRFILDTDGYKFATGSNSASLKGFGGSLDLRYYVVDNLFVYGKIGFGSGQKKLGSQKVQIGQDLVYGFTPISADAPNLSVGQTRLVLQNAYTNVTEKMKFTSMAGLAGIGYEAHLNDNFSVEVKAGIGIARSKISLDRSASSAVLTDGKTPVKDPFTIQEGRTNIDAVNDDITTDNLSRANAAGDALNGRFMTVPLNNITAKSIFEHTKNHKFSNVKYRSSSNFIGEVGVTGYYKVNDRFKIGVGYTLGIDSTSTLKVKLDRSGNDYTTINRFKHDHLNDVKFKSSLSHNFKFSALFGF